MDDEPIRFTVEGDLYILADRSTASSLGGEEVRAGEARQILASARRGSLWGEWGHQPFGGGVEALAQREALARRVESNGDIKAEGLILLRMTRPQYGGTLLLKPEVPDLADLSDQPIEERENTWFEVLVVDDLDEPCRGIEYEVELSDGRVRRGRTNEHGILRYDGLPEGQCTVTLLDVEAKAWEQV